MLATSCRGTASATPEASVVAPGALITGTALGLTVKATARSPLPAALLALKVALNNPLWVGVPETLPLAVLNASPGGKLPATKA